MRVKNVNRRVRLRLRDRFKNKEAVSKPGLLTGA